MKHRMRSVTTQTVIILLVALLIADAMFAYAMLRHSRQSMTEMVHERMLDLADTAADLIDGDVLEALTAADQNTAEYLRIYDTLARFKQNITLDYIYTIRSHSDGSFTFIADPAEDASGFGTPVVATDALRRAAAGESAVDSVPYTDEWGSFYSAYSPVFDSRGQVAGIVAVDFNANWYDAQLAESTRTILITTVISLIVGAAIALLATGSMRRRFRELNGELSRMATDMEGLTRELAEGKETPPASAPAPMPQAKNGGDDLAPLMEKIRLMHGELHDYITYAKEQAYIDPMTGLGNKTAYLEMLKASEPHFADGSAEFAITIFDIDDLKGVNDNYGHEIGDGVIAACGDLIRNSFGPDHTYRIGGDEFIVVRAGAGETEIAKWSAILEAEIRRFNDAGGKDGLPISLSWGSAVYDPAVDADFRSVFKRADEAMYCKKSEHYGSGNVRSRSAQPAALS